MSNQAGTTGGFFDERDEKMVENLRRVVTQWDRRSWLFKSLGAMASLSFFGFLIWMLPKIVQWGLNPAWQGLLPGLVVGLIMGYLVGHAIKLMVPYLMVVWIDIFRSERLLIRYHDALRDLVSRLAEDADSFRNRDAKE